MEKYVIDLHLFSKKLCAILINKKMTDNNGYPDPIKLYNVLNPNNQISESDIKKFGRSNFTEKTRKERNWINGMNYPKRMDDVFSLCNALECDLDYFFTDMPCKTHDKQFIQNETGLSEKAIEELHYLALLDSTLAAEPDLSTINTLLEQLASSYNNIIHAITGYLRSNGLSNDTWYDIRTETLSEKEPPIDTDRVHIPAHSDIFDNLLLMDIQKQIVNLKKNLRKAPDTN